MSYPLFDRYPNLKAAMPRIELGDWPTPVVQAEALGSELGINLWIKRDDISAEPYGGNKVRKLELHLGKALKEKRKTVLTYGYAGSNHATATAVYASKNGLKPISLLLPQANAQYVAKNLMLQQACGTELYQFASRADIAAETIRITLREIVKNGSAPLRIPPGGSSPLGAAAFVNAAFELAEQIEKKECPEPDFIYVAGGSLGTAAGLALGVRAAGLKTQVVPVKVIPAESCTDEKLADLMLYTSQTLEHKGRFPRFQPDSVPQLRSEFVGEGYARISSETNEAIRRADEADMKLDGTYAGKAFAALLSDAKAGCLSGKNVMFWNTKNSHNFAPEIAHQWWLELPRPFHIYFRTRPLDEKERLFSHDASLQRQKA